MTTSQLFKGDNYEMLHPTYVICFLNETLLADAAYHHCFHVYDKAQGVELCKDLEIHLLELSKFEVTVEEVKTPLEQWCYFFKHGASLDLATLPPTLNDPGIRMGMEVLMKASQEEIERHRAAERLKGQRDAADLLATAEEKGIQKGIDKGLLIGGIHMLQKLLGQPETSREELARLSIPDLVQLEETLERQFSAKKQTNGTPPSNPS